jgi:hypothetical protein
MIAGPAAHPPHSNKPRLPAFSQGALVKCFDLLSLLRLYFATSGLTAD